MRRGGARRRAGRFPPPPRCDKPRRLRIVQCPTPAPRRSPAPAPAPAQRTAPCRARRPHPAESDRRLGSILRAHSGPARFSGSQSRRRRPPAPLRAGPGPLWARPTAGSDRSGILVLRVTHPSRQALAGWERQGQGRQLGRLLKSGFIRRPLRLEPTHAEGSGAVTLKTQGWLRRP
jgi:hypothetical protein